MAWKDLATAYDAKQDYQSAIPAWQQYTTLRPKDDAGLQALAGDLQQQFDAQTNDAALAQSRGAERAGDELRAAVRLSARPRAREHARPDRLGGQPGRERTASTTALSARQTTATQLVGVYQKLAKLDPAEPSIQLQLGQQAQAAGDTATAIAAYETLPQARAGRAERPAGEGAAEAAEGAVNRVDVVLRRLDSRADGDNTDLRELGGTPT